MGMGYGANSAYVVDVDKLKELNLPSFEEFQKIVDRESAENLMCFVSTSFLEESLVELWDLLQEEFRDATGLDLYIGYHDCESEGSGYDEVDGIYYYADRVVTPTLAGAKALESGLVEKKWWVSFG